MELKGLRVNIGNLTKVMRCQVRIGLLAELQESILVHVQLRVFVIMFGLSAHATNGFIKGECRFKVTAICMHCPLHCR